MTFRSATGLLLVLLSFLSHSSAREFEKLPRVSTFAKEKISRDPFRRIDGGNLSMQGPVVIPVDRSADDLIQLFQITAVSIDRLAIAIINGKALAENERFTIKARDKEIRVTVVKIQAEAVDLDCAGTSVTVPITRRMPGQPAESPDSP